MEIKIYHNYNYELPSYGFIFCSPYNIIFFNPNSRGCNIFDIGFKKSDTFRKFEDNKIELNGDNDYSVFHKILEMELKDKNFVDVENQDGETVFIEFMKEYISPIIDKKCPELKV